MITTADFLTATYWGIGLTIACGILAGLAFVFQWGLRFRLVGVTGFMGVLTGGLFALSLFPFTRTAIPGAVPYTVVFDNGGGQAVIAVAPSITESALEATLQQAAADLFSYGRVGARLTVRARTIVHPQPGTSQPLTLGQATRTSTQATEAMPAGVTLDITINHDNIAKLAQNG
jgi:hypothetical protein